MKDETFFYNVEVLDHLLPLLDLETTTRAAMKLSNQKNRFQGSCVHHHIISNQELYPVQALARRVHHIYANNGSRYDKLCTFVDHVRKSVVLDQDMNNLMKVSAVDLKFDARGFLATRVGMNSL